MGREARLRPPRHRPERRRLPLHAVSGSDAHLGGATDATANRPMSSPLLGQTFQRGIKLEETENEEDER